MRLPDRRLAIACLCNLTVSAASLARRVADLFLDASQDAAPAPDPRRAQRTAVLGADQRRALVGLYRDERGDQFLEVFEQDETLQARIAGSTWRLRALQDDVLALEDSNMELILDRGRGADGPVSALVVADRARFRRVTRADPSQAAWEALAGTYVSPELDVPYRIEAVAGGASVSWLKQAPVSLRPAVPGVFFADRLTIRTVRDRRGRVTGFTLDTGRVRGLRFERR